MRRCFYAVAAATAACGLENGAALTPQQGWRSWNNFGLKVDANLILEIAKGLVDTSRTVNGAPTSLAELGYVDLGVG